MLERIFAPRSGSSGPSVKNVHPQQLALVFMILAIGTLYNLELPLHDPQAEEYLALSKACLARGDFLNHNTIPGVQAVVSGYSDSFLSLEYLSDHSQIMMGHYHL